MQRPGHKIGTREANPNEYITFIRALEGKKDTPRAEHILKAVAAQMKKIMEKRFMLVGTLEEARFNNVFAGRNWNHGATIELVLRGPSGKFLPIQYILNVMCHEMAHITHMNHGPEFQKLNAAIKADVAEMHRRGYYGDGFWSDGKRLHDSARMGADAFKQSDFPEYICGVTASDSKRGRRARGRPASSRTPGLVKGEASHRSGRQTDFRRKAGRRTNVDMGESSGRLDGRREITAQDRENRQKYIDRNVKMLVNTGMTLAKAKRRAADMFDEENPWFKEGSTRGKVAKSKTAAELRAAAAERRLALLSGVKKEEDGVKTEEDGVKKEEEQDELDPTDDDERDVKPDIKPDITDYEPEDDDGEGFEVEDPHLSVEERKKEMESEMTSDEKASLRGGWREFLQQAVAVGRASASGSSSPTKPVDDDDDDIVFLSSEPGPSTRSGQGSSKRKADVTDSNEDRKPLAKRTASSRSFTHPKSPQVASSSSSAAPRFDQASLIRQERLRALGLATTGPSSGSRLLGSSGSSSQRNREWQCARCTFINQPEHDSCDMCSARPDGSIA